jgi:hypothetical protein
MAPDGDGTRAAEVSGTRGAGAGTPVAAPGRVPTSSLPGLSISLCLLAGLLASFGAPGAAVADGASVVERAAVLSGDVRQVVASRTRVAVIQGHDVVLLSATGALLGRLERDPAPLFARSRAGRGLSVDEIVDLAGIPDDDLESDEVEEALDEEGVGLPPIHGGGAARRHAASDGGAGAGARQAEGATQALAAAGGAVWAATSAGLWRADPDDDTSAARWPATPIGPRGLPLGALAVAEGGSGLAGLSGNRLLRSSDGGASWMLLAVLPAPARAIEISRDGGEVFLLDDEGVSQVAHRTRLPIFAGRAHHLARCGDDLLILADDGVYAWNWQTGVERRGGRLPARRLGCSPVRPDLVMAIGTGLMLSSDGGRTWAERDDLPMLDIQSAALAPDRVWIGTAAGLFQAPLDRPGPPAGPPGGGDRFASGDTASETAAALARMSPRPWQRLLPRITLAIATDVTYPGQSETAFWLLLTFPLGRSHTSAQGALDLARDLTRRRTAAVAALTWLAAGEAGGGNDGGVGNDGARATDTADEETAAETRALLDSLEDLR